MNIQSYIQKSLSELGLSFGEATVYFYILMKQNLDAFELKKLTRLSLAGVYKILNSLINGEFIRAVKNGRGMVYSAVPLNTIASKFAVKGRKMARTSDKFKELSKLQNLDSATEVLEENSLTDYYLNIPYKLDDFIFCVGSYEACVTFMGEGVEREFVRTRAHHGKSASAIIFDDSRYTRDLVKRNAKEKRETKVIPNESYPNEFNYIFSDKFLTFYKDAEGKVKILEVKSPHVASSQMAQFRALWKAVE